MSERMGDGTLKIRVQTVRAVCPAFPELDRVLEELDRARQSETEKTKTIKALADALWEQNDTGVMEEGVWHSHYCIARGRASCSDECTRARAALRLAGRLTK